MGFAFGLKYVFSPCENAEALPTRSTTKTLHLRTLCALVIGRPSYYSLYTTPFVPVSMSPKTCDAGWFPEKIKSVAGGWPGRARKSAMASTAVEVPVRAQPSWIVSARADLLWFTLGGAAVAYAFWALWRFAHASLLLLVAVWAIVFDETHGFATISRTYFDAQERERRGRWLWGSLAFFFAIGPVLILLGLGDWLELATELWGYYHIFKQHYGFMMMYKKKNRDFNSVDT